MGFLSSFISLFPAENFFEESFTRDGARDIKAKCVQIAWHETSPDRVRSNYSGCPGRWKELVAYLTSGGNLIVYIGRHSQWDGEKSQFDVHILKSREEVIAYTEKHTDEITKTLFYKIGMKGVLLGELEEIVE
jgi:hypothetical protein